jgi:glycosyltransferase involved in cell wall biosynthesis
MPFLAVLIPAYNVCDHIGEILKELQNCSPKLHIVVVDDGSSDGTIELVSQKFPSITCLGHTENRGKGEALKTGIDYIIKNIDVKAIVFLDGDGQHDPRDMKQFIRSFNDNCGNFIIGKRKFLPGKMPISRIASNFMTSNLISLKLMKSIADSQCGFRLIEVNLLKKLLPIKSKGFELETEILLKAGKLQARFHEVPVSTIYQAEKSNIKPFRDIFRFIRTFLTT